MTHPVPTKERKTCLLHGCLPSNCGCPDDVSQSDYKIVTRIVSSIPTFIDLGGLPEGITKDTKGPFRIVEQVSRELKYPSSGLSYSHVTAKVIFFEKVDN